MPIGIHQVGPLQWGRITTTLAVHGEKDFAESDGLRHIHKALNDAHFLFGPEVQAYLQKLWGAGIKVSLVFPVLTVDTQL